jgi:DtxR family Mn-dependent transcriptional regulator
VASATVENYVKAVFRLTETGDDRPATTGRLAEAMGVSPGTVTSMLKTLDEAGLASYTPYEGVRLTDVGRSLALRVFRRHRLLECFLCRSLGLQWDEVHEDAERIEHHVSDFLIERIDGHLGHPRFDPHGDPIPTADGSMPTREIEPLVDCPSPTRFRLARVQDQSPDFLRYLTQSGLSPGTTASLTANHIEAGVVVLRVNGRDVTLSREAAGKLLVTLLEPTKRHNPRAYPAAEPHLDSATCQEAPPTAP